MNSTASRLAVVLAISGTHNYYFATTMRSPGIPYSATPEAWRKDAGNFVRAAHPTCNTTEHSTHCLRSSPMSCVHLAYPAATDSATPYPRVCIFAVPFEFDDIVRSCNTY